MISTLAEQTEEAENKEKLKNRVWGFFNLLFFHVNNEQR